MNVNVCVRVLSEYVCTGTWLCACVSVNLGVSVSGRLHVTEFENEAESGCE